MIAPSFWFPHVDGMVWVTLRETDMIAASLEEGEMQIKVFFRQLAAIDAAHP